MTRTVNIFKRDSSIMTWKTPLFLLQAEKSKTLFSRCCWLVILLQPAPLFVCLLDLQGWLLFKQATQLVLAFITVNQLPCQPFLCSSLRLELFLLKKLSGRNLLFGFHWQLTACWVQTLPALTRPMSPILQFIFQMIFCKDKSL